jgi:hypothetical protein
MLGHTVALADRQRTHGCTGGQPTLPEVMMSSPKMRAKFAFSIMDQYRFWPRDNDNNHFARVSKWNSPAYVNSFTAQSSG